MKAEIFTSLYHLIEFMTSNDPKSTAFFSVIDIRDTFFIQ